MIVVADTTPLRYLVAFSASICSRTPYGRVIVLPAVVGELSHKSAPAPVRAWLGSHPDWLEIRHPSHTLPPEVNLDQGEREAIALAAELAAELAADLLLVDDWDARREAERRHLHVAGTLRVLADGGSRGLIDLAESFDRLRGTNFRVNSKLLESLADEYSRQRRS